jgi:hypothetical protein
MTLLEVLFVFHVGYGASEFYCAVVGAWGEVHFSCGGVCVCVCGCYMVVFHMEICVRDRRRSMMSIVAIQSYFGGNLKEVASVFVGALFLLWVGLQAYSYVTMPSKFHFCAIFTCSQIESELMWPVGYKKTVTIYGSSLGSAIGYRNGVTTTITRNWIFYRTVE